MGTISFVAQGTTPATTGVGTGDGASNLNPDTPAHNVGDLLLVFAAAHTGTALPTPSGYSLVTGSNISGGGGTDGTDTGPTDIVCWIRTADGSAADTVPSVDLATGAEAWGQMLVYRGSDGTNTTWDVTASGGTDTVADTSWSVTTGADPGIQGDDWVVVGSSIPTDASAGSRWSAQAISTTGITYGAMTERSEPSTTRGGDCGGMLCDFVVTSGTSSATSVFTATASTGTNQNGCSSVVRIRAISPAAGLVGRNTVVDAVTIFRASVW